MALFRHDTRIELSYSNIPSPNLYICKIGILVRDQSDVSGVTAYGHDVTCAGDVDSMGCNPRTAGASSPNQILDSELPRHHIRDNSLIKNWNTNRQVSIHLRGEMLEDRRV